MKNDSMKDASKKALECAKKFGIKTNPKIKKANLK